MESKHIKWEDNIIVPIIMRPCECQCCLGCNKNGNDCGKFSPYYCKKCSEWRCIKCYNLEINECRYCLRDWKKNN